MLRIRFRDVHGEDRSLETRGGISLMEALRENAVDGVDADCGGCCACATCHVYVDTQWQDRVGALGSIEGEMLDLVEHRRYNSRLSCQIKLAQTLDGLTVEIPATQS